jgi:hypothetical protein
MGEHAAQLLKLMVLKPQLLKLLAFNLLPNLPQRHRHRHLRHLLLRLV